MSAEPKSTRGLFLVGFMGSGKSTVGRRLAAELGWEFYDLDEQIEREQGSSISHIFERQGEAAFRSIEAAALRSRVEAIRAGRPAIVALGGGAFVQPRNAELLKAQGITIWLDCPLRIMKSRVEGHAHRPLARDPKKFEELYYARREAYARADYRIAEDTSDAAVAAILRLPIF